MKLQLEMSLLRPVCWSLHLQRHQLHKITRRCGIGVLPNEMVVHGRRAVPQAGSLHPDLREMDLAENQLLLIPRDLAGRLDSQGRLIFRRSVPTFPV